MVAPGTRQAGTGLESAPSSGVTAYGWKGFLRRHWGAVAAFAAAVVLVISWAVYVFWWFAISSQSSGMVPSRLGLWTTGNLVSFIIYSILWELLLVGIPVAVGGIAAWLWWKRLPYDERMGMRWGRRGRSAGGSGGFGFFLFILFCIKVYFDGNWNVPLATFSVNYMVGSVITILAYLVAIIGIPVAIAMTLWIRHEMKKP